MSQMIFTKYSAERDERFAIRTDIVKKEDGTLEVEKRALYPEGEGHVAQLFRWYELLSKEYDADQFLVNRCRKIPDGMAFSYLYGITLQQKLEHLAREGREEAITGWVDQYFERMGRGDHWIPYRKTEEFVRVFGDVELPDTLKCRRVTDIDMIFSNIVLDGDDWHFIDYEWTFDFPVPLNFVLYRACFLASNEIADASCLRLSAMMERLGIGEKEQQIYESMESHFQEYIRNHAMPIRDMLANAGYRVIPMSEVEKKFAKTALSNITAVCIGEDGERLACQSKMEIYSSGEDEEGILLMLPEKTVRLRIVIGCGSALVQMKRCLIDRIKQPVEGLAANGMELGGGLYLMLAETAELEIPCMGGESAEIYLRVQDLDPSVNRALISRFHGLYEQRTSLENELMLLRSSRYYKAYEKLKRLLKRRPEGI